MIAPLSWLKEYVDIDCTPQELQDKLFSCGFEVEELNEVGKDISKVVVGLVEKCDAIPDTHLHVCSVNCGEHGTFQICCGADNVEAGKKFPTALVGATVYGTNRERTAIEGVMTIKKGKLRGFDSYGMLCSGMELGVSEDMYPGAGYNGLLLLPDDAEVGADVKPIIGLDDWLFDIAITANRPDCQSIFGIAREVAAVLEKPLKTPALDYTETDVKLDNFNITVDAPELCPRYIGHYVYDVKIGPSPAWMRRRLALVGMNAISNMVDITNYILTELGQPMHAFDYAYLRGNGINVRTAKDGEKIVTLDEQELTLNSSNLVICDGERPVALAGVMGGLNSEILDTTQSVMFEAAKFARDNIRRTSRSVGKRTDSSARFEKGVDEYSTVMAMKRALHLVEELGCGKVSSTHFDVNTGNSVEPREMSVEIDRISGVLGITVPDEDIVRIMNNLDMKPEISDKDGKRMLTLQVPAYRDDMEGYQDVAEEVIRMYGYDNLVPTFLKSAEVTTGGWNPVQRREMRVKEALCGLGAYECMHYSFFSPADLDLLRYPEDAQERKAIRIMNPISEELSLMRTTLTASMIHAVVRNQKNGRLDGRLFEIAKVFVPKALPLTEYPDERDHLVVAFWGKGEDFFTVKGAAETVADTLHVKFSYKAATRSFTHPYQTADVICEGQTVGYIGKLAYDIAESESMRTDLYLMELDLAALYPLCGDTPAFEPLPKFLDVSRDLALVMDKNITCAQVEDQIRAACKYVTDIKLFDIYEGMPIPPTMKSMAFTVTFRQGEEEFTAEDLDRFVAKILRKLDAVLGITLRT